MARPARLQFEGAFYHIINRGNGRSSIFHDDTDRSRFLEILAAVQKKTGMVIHAFVLMPNHYHLLAETPNANLSRAIQQLNGNYALYYSRRRKKPGHLFQGRFKAFLVEKDAYLLELTRYIHLNPVRAKIVESPEEFIWSSHSTYLSGKNVFPCAIEWEWILSIFGTNRRRAVVRYKEFVFEGIGKNTDVYSSAKGGWMLGRDSWVEKMVDQLAPVADGELSGIRQITGYSSLDSFDRAVCAEFAVKSEQLKHAARGNVARQAAILFALDHCALTIKGTSERYGGNYFANAKAVSRFRKQLAGNSKLKLALARVLSNVQV